MRLDLCGTWEFRCVTDGCPEEWKTWREGRVPGTVHTDLLDAGLIPDPFVADNEVRVQPVHEMDWLYRCHFEWTKPGSGRTYLVCEGLDTVAEIRLNGQVVGLAEDMFVPYRFDVADCLRQGSNCLEITFRSPIRAAEERRERMGPLVADYDKYDERRFYIRKAQYSFGWDWGPALPTCGIWRPIYLEHVDGPRLRDVWLKTLELASGKVSAETEVEIEGYRDEIELQFELRRKDRVVLRDSCPAEGEVVQREWELLGIDLWWPNGYGEPALYDLDVILKQNGREVDRIRRRVGFRTIELLLEDDGGPCFRFRVNGKDIFVKGANWIPADNFVPRVSEDKYRFLLQRAAEAHMNLVRVWGGGIYENDTFYDLCDELGLLVWQDFMFACGVYPEDEQFLQLVEREAEANVRRLRWHASVAIWCGNNECEWIWRMRTGRPIQEMPGHRIFHELLPKVCAELDPTRPYWPSTPWGDPEDPNGQQRGNRHQWDIWSRWVDYREIRQDRSLFVTEFGWQAPACQPTLDRVLPPEERHPQSRLFEFHNKQIEGTERLFRFLAAHLRVDSSYPDFIYLTQVNQGEALKACVEHWRRRWPATSGAVIWQLNDCWPVTSWSLIDGDLREKAAYFYARRFFAPLLLSMEKAETAFAIWVHNDLSEEFKGRVRWQLRRFTGEVLREGEFPVSVGACGCARIGQIETGFLGQEELLHAYAVARLFDGSGRCVSRALELLVEPKHARLPEPSVRVEEFLVNGGQGRMVLTSEAFAKAVYVHLPGVKLEDNFFDLEPGERKMVRFQTVDGAAVDTSKLGIMVVR